jgi:cbb3-type cytochrome c oxidase subunit III
LKKETRVKKTPLVLSTGVFLLVGAAAPIRAEGERSENFQTHCTVCHGDNGKGQTEEGRKKKARDLTNAKWQDTIDDARIVRSITKGHDEMPAFGKKLSEAEIKALAAEVRSLAKKPS